METRANYVLIGLFTLAVLAAGMGFVFWFSRTGVEGERATYNVVFKGSVSGLKKGAQVLFNGIRVGEVTDLDLNPKDPREAVVTLVVDSARGTIRKDTRITLEYQGLTGIASVALQGGDPAAEPYKAGPGEKYPTIVVDTAGVQDLAQGARELIARADTILRRLDEFVVGNQQSASNVIKNVERFTTVLGDNADEVAAFMKDAAAAARKFSTMAERIETLAVDVNTLVKAIDSEKVQRSVDNVERFTDTLGRSAAYVDSLVKDAAEVARKFNGMSDRLDSVVTRANEVLQAIVPEQINRTVANVDRFTTTLGQNSERVDAMLKDATEIARQFNGILERNTAYVDSLVKDVAEVAGKFNGMSDRLANVVTRADDVLQAINPEQINRTVANVDRFTTSLGANSEKVDSMLKDAAEIARQFNAMTPRVDKILANLEGLTGSDTTQGAIADIAAAAKSVRQTADNLDKRFIEISAGITRFTASGSREVEAIASEGRRALATIERAVRNIDRNPSRVIFGGNGNSTVPQYGRR